MPGGKYSYRTKLIPSQFCFLGNQQHHSDFLYSPRFITTLKSTELLYAKSVFTLNHTYPSSCLMLKRDKYLLVIHTFLYLNTEFLLEEKKILKNTFTIIGIC